MPAMTTSSVDLLGVLDNAGVVNLREGTKEVSGSCPGHLQRVGHLDTHSSWSINKTSFLHHCFSCGYSGTLSQLLVDLTGAAPEGLQRDLNAANFLSKMAKRHQEHPSDPDDPPPLTEWALKNTMLDVPQRLLDLRGLKREAIDTFGVRWDPERRFWVLPVRSPYGDLLGAQYRQKGNVLTLPKGMEKSTTLFGLSAMKAHDTVAVVESPLDAVRMFGAGIPAVSSLGAWVSPEQVRLLSRNFSRVVLALDNDSTGIQAARQCQYSLKKTGTPAFLFRYHGMGGAKDVGDVASDDAIYVAWLRTLRCGL